VHGVPINAAGPGRRQTPSLHGSAHRGAVASTLPRPATRRRDQKKGAMRVLAPSARELLGRSSQVLSSFVVAMPPKVQRPFSHARSGSGLAVRSGIVQARHGTPDMRLLAKVVRRRDRPASQPRRVVLPPRRKVRRANATPGWQVSMQGSSLVRSPVARVWANWRCCASRSCPRGNGPIRRSGQLGVAQQNARSIMVVEQ
jgi:hypothetical protein